MSEGIASWVDGYQHAWDTNDPADIIALFTPDAEYRAAPHDAPWVGHDAIVAGWLGARDEPGDATFSWRALVDNPDIGVVQGVTVYANSSTYDNLWIISLAPDGRARSFTDWWVERG